MAGEQAPLQEQKKKVSLGIYKYNSHNPYIVRINKDPLCIFDNPDGQDFSIEHLEKLNIDPVYSLPIVEEMINVSRSRILRFQAYFGGKKSCCNKYAASLKKNPEYLKLAEDQYYNLFERGRVLLSLTVSYDELNRLSPGNNVLIPSLSVNLEDRRADSEQEVVDTVEKLKKMTTEIAVMDAKISSYVNSISGYGDAVSGFYLGNSMGNWSGYPTVDMLLAQNKDYAELTAEGRKTKHADRVADKLCIMHYPRDVQDINPNDIITKAVTSISEDFLKLVENTNHERMDAFYPYTMPVDFTRYRGYDHPGCAVGLFLHNKYSMLAVNQYENLDTRQRLVREVSNILIRIASDVKLKPSHGSGSQLTQDRHAQLAKRLEDLKQVTAKIAKTDSLLHQYVETMPEYASKVKDFYMRHSNNSWSGVQVALSSENEATYCKDESLNNYWADDGKASPNNEEPSTQNQFVFCVYVLASIVVLFPFWSSAIVDAYHYLFPKNKDAVCAAAEGRVGDDVVCNGEFGLSASSVNDTSSLITTDAYAQPLKTKQDAIVVSMD